MWNRKERISRWLRGQPLIYQAFEGSIFKPTHLDGLSIVHFDHVEAEAVDPLAWCYEYTGGKVEVVADVY